MTGEGSCRVQVDNARVRVARWDLPPGAGTGLHRHLHDYVVVPLVHGRMQVTDDSGAVSETELEAGGSYFRVAGSVHDVVNAGVDPLSFVEVELLRS